MKKIVLAGASIAALAMAAPAAAQSSSTVSQTGNGNTADVFQENANTSTVTQVGDNNIAVVDQTIGDGNVSTVTQNATGANEAAVFQNGLDGTSTIEQTADATDDVAIVVQDVLSVGATATITQTGNGGGPSANIALIDQDDGSNSTASIAQIHPFRTDVVYAGRRCYD